MKFISILLGPVRFVRILPGLSIQLAKYFLVDVAVRPTVLAALGVHAVLLVLPLWDLSSQSLEGAVEEEVVEDPTLEAVSLGDLLATSKLPPEAVPPPPEPLVEPQAPLVEPVLTEVPDNLPEALPSEEFPEEPVIEPEEPFQDDPPEPEPSLAFNPAMQSQFTSGVNARLGQTAGSDFDNTDQWPPLRSQIRRIPATDLPAFFLASSIQDGSYQPLTGAGLKFIGRNTELIIRENLPETTAEAGFLLGPAESYSNHPLYAITTSTGDPVSYVSLLDMKGSTVVITWPYDPRQGIP